MFIVTHYLIYLNSYLEINIIKYIYYTKKNIISININSNIFFIIFIDIRTYYFYRTVGYLENRY